MTKPDILYSDAERWLRDDPDASKLMRDAKDPRWANNRKLAWKWLTIDKLLKDTEDGPAIDIQKMVNTLETKEVSKNKIDWAKTLFKLIPENERKFYHYTPFASYEQIFSYLQNKVVVSKASHLAKQMEQKYTEKEQKNYISKIELQKLFHGWVQQHKDALFQGSNTDPAILKLRRVCLLGCLTLLNGPVRRREYLLLQTQRNESETRRRQPQNYIRDVDFIVLEKYKTVKHYGTYVKQIQDPLTLQIISKIQLSTIWNVENQQKSENDKYYLFDQKADMTGQFQDAFEMITKARSVKEGGPVRLNPNLLRKIDIEHYAMQGKLDSMEGKAWLARCQGNNPSTQLLFYTKNNGKLQFAPDDLSDNGGSSSSSSEEESTVHNPANDSHGKSGSLSAQSIRLLEFLAPTLADESYISWVEFYRRQDLFENRKLGEVFGEIGGKEMSHEKRIRKVRYFLDCCPLYKTEEEINQMKEDSLERALKSKTKKRLLSWRKTLKLTE